MSNWFFLERDIEHQIRVLRREAAQRRLLRHARLGRNGWLPKTARTLLIHFGDMLVTVGLRFQRYGQPQQVFFETSVNGGILSNNGE